MLGTIQMASSAHTPSQQLLVVKKVPCQAKWHGFEASDIFPRLVTIQLFLVFMTIRCSERTTIW
jgi:hypothetical protein